MQNTSGNRQSQQEHLFKASGESTLSKSQTNAFELKILSQSPVKIWGLYFDFPEEKVNKFDLTVLAEFKNILGELKEKQQANEIEALILYSRKKGNFVAGADIRMIESIKDPSAGEKLSSEGHVLFNEWEDLTFPTIAAIDGTALGGGCEIALASSSIVVSSSDKTRIGLPEVMLGVVPGLGGCVRLPARIGIAQSLDLILTGKQVRAEKAYKMGLADALIPKENFHHSVLEWVEKNYSALKQRKNLARKPQLGGMGGFIGGILEGNFIGRSIIYKKAKEGVLSKTRGHYPAPLEAISVLQKNGVCYGPKLKGATRAKALKNEAKTFGKLAATPISKNLISIFYLTESIKKKTGLPNERKVIAPSIQSTGVLGAGVMGGGIAQLFSNKGHLSKMKDITNAALETGIKAANRLFQKDLKRRKITKREYFQKMNLIVPTLSYQGFESLDLVVEAVVENMDVKKKVLQELEKNVSKKCLIASNTSSLSINEMQTSVQNPERFLGLHFFNPVHRMPLVEIIRGEKTSDEAVVSLYEFSKAVGKFPIVVKDAAGFLVNRLLGPYISESMHLLAQGAPINEIDHALLEFGMPMGPMELIDEVGVDVAQKVGKSFRQAFGERMTSPPLHEKIIEKGRLGKKTNKGIYNYDPTNPKKKTLPTEIYDYFGVKPKSGIVSQKEIIERSILPMINEACRCLDEKIVETIEDIDLGMIMGTGFPPFRGGLMTYAKSISLKTVVEKLKHYETIYGVRFAPSEALLRYAENDHF